MSKDITLSCMQALNQPVYHGAVVGGKLIIMEDELGWVGRSPAAESNDGVARIPDRQ